MRGLKREPFEGSPLSGALRYLFTLRMPICVAHSDSVTLEPQESLAFAAPSPQAGVALRHTS